MLYIEYFILNIILKSVKDIDNKNNYRCMYIHGLIYRHVFPSSDLLRRSTFRGITLTVNTQPDVGF